MDKTEKDTLIGCPICGKNLSLPVEYLDALTKLRCKIEEFRPIIIQDFIVNDLQPALFKVVKSHSGLAEAEYGKNQEYNNTHFSHKAEEELIVFMERFGMMDDYFKFASQT